jgi:hypothetical protein
MYNREYTVPDQPTVLLPNNPMDNLTNPNLYNYDTGLQESKSGFNMVEPEGTFSNPKSKLSNPNTPDSNLGQMSTMDWFGLAAGAGANAVHAFRKPDQVNYDRVRSTPVNMEPAIIDTRNDINTGISGVAYDIRQNAPTAGSYLANRTSAGIKGAQAAGKAIGDIRMRQELANTEMKNKDNYANVEISRLEKIDQAANDAAARNFDRTAAAGIYGVTAQGIKNKNQEGINQTIAENIGTAQVKWINKKPYINVNGKWVPWA